MNAAAYNTGVVWLSATQTVSRTSTKKVKAGDRRGKFVIRLSTITMRPEASWEAGNRPIISHTAGYSSFNLWAIRSMCGLEVKNSSRKKMIMKMQLTVHQWRSGAPTLCSWVATKVWNPGATPKPSSWTNGGSAWLWICTRTPASKAVSSARKMKRPSKWVYRNVQENKFAFWQVRVNCFRKDEQKKRLFTLIRYCWRESKSEFYVWNNLLVMISRGFDSKPKAFRNVSVIKHTLRDIPIVVTSNTVKTTWCWLHRWKSFYLSFQSTHMIISTHTHR